jgi:multicomponent K+:H+ antiporter subunit C
MELLVASAIGMMTACGVYLTLRKRTFPVIVGLALLSYAVNVFIFASGRLAIGLPAIITSDAAGYTDPLTQALVLTAIVISFGMTALIVMMALGAFLETGDDHIGMEEDSKPQPTPPQPTSPKEGLK